MSFGFLEISSHGPFKEEYFILIYRTGYGCDAMGNHSILRYIHTPYHLVLL